MHLKSRGKNRAFSRGNAESVDEKRRIILAAVKLGLKTDLIQDSSRARALSSQRNNSDIARR